MGYDLKYMDRPPTILPNYGKKKQIPTPRSSLTRVLLYDNANQKHILKNRITQIKREQKKSVHFLEMQKNSFLLRRGQRIRELKEEVNKEKSTLPKIETNQRTTNQVTPPRSSREPSPPPSEQDDDECESPLAVVIEHIKLPEIDPDREKRHIVFKLKDNYGDTKIYHTIDDGILSDVIPLHSFYRKGIQDPRFKELEDVLLPAKLF